jgi:hypothetical protein
MSFIINPYTFAAAPDPSQLLREDFEPTGATGWTTNSGYTPWNDQYMTAPLAPIEGTRSAAFLSAGSGSFHAYKNFTAAGSCYVRFRFYWTAPGSVGNGILCSLRDASGNPLITLGLLGTSNAFRVQMGTGGVSNTSIAPTVGTHLYGWMEFVKGSGNAIGRVGWTTTPTRPSWPSSGNSGQLIVVNTGTANADASRILFGRADAAINWRFVFDDIQVQSTPFA